jgi:mRNA interferase MazF
VICERHDVVVVPFPFHEKFVRKRRPALVLSGKNFNEGNGWTLFAMITTAKQTAWPSDIAISELEAAGLPLPCVIRMRLQTLPNGILIRKLGRLGPRDMLASERQFAATIL